MKKLWKKIPKGWALALEALILLGLLLAAWVLLDYPALSAASAFRRGLEDAALPAVQLELVENDLGLGADGSNTYVVRLGRDVGWRAYDAWSIPAAEGVFYAPLNWRSVGGFHYKWEEPVPDFAEDFAHDPVDYEQTAFPRVLDEEMPAFAVKAEGANAELTLELKDWVSQGFQYDEPHRWLAGSYPLTLLERRDGWFIFGFDMELLREERLETTDENTGETEYWFAEPVATFVEWIQNYKPWYRDFTCPAGLELRCYDSGGTLIKTAAWDLAIPETP